MEAHVIEAMLLRWGESHASGRTVTFVLPEDDGPHPFKGMKCGPANGQRVALSVALINDDETQAPKERRSFDELPLSQQAALLCNEPRFRRFLFERYETEDTSDAAAKAVRIDCGVESRADLDKSQNAAARWRKLHSEYQAWLRT